MNIVKLFKSKNTGNLIIAIALIVFLYSLIALYFTNHFFFNTVINGVDVSLKAHNGAKNVIRSSIKDYRLQLNERNDKIEEIIGYDIGLEFNESNDLYKIGSMQSPFKWIIPLFKEQRHYVDNLFLYNKEGLKNKINQLNCLNKEMIQPQNVGFQYSNGSYEVVEEIYGDKIIKDKLSEAIENCIQNGETNLDLNEKLCYENPKYTLKSHKTYETQKLLNKCITTKITYQFGSENEVLDRSTIHPWLSTDENLDVVIHGKAVREYVQKLGRKYDTAGATKKFKTSAGKMIEVKGGFYGWKINTDAESEALIENIKHGETLEREPIYIQKAIVRGEDEIGSTYVEINITRQHLWFYKKGKLVVQGAVVTGNPNRGNATKLGTYMLNYKEEGSILRGFDYEAPVRYWMPFNGNIGIHDASWRYSFGGEIYKTNGTHGCVNAPRYLAQRIYENIEEGTPIICYEEENTDAS